MTIGIAALTISGAIVAVSDQRITYYDAFRPAERGANKIIQLTEDRSWFLAFAASDVAMFSPLIRRIRSDLAALSPEERTLDAVMQTTADAYSAVRIEQFVAQHLRAIGYVSLDAFQKEGYRDLGKDEHAKHMMTLYQFDLGVELLVFGHTDTSVPRLFKVANPGRSVDCSWEGYGVVGTGSYLALGALRQRPLSINLIGAIYRVLEAKFIAEEASHVGKSTTLIVLHPGQTGAELADTVIAKVRAAWMRQQAEPIPEAARDAIANSEPVKIADDATS